MADAFWMIGTMAMLLAGTAGLAFWCVRAVGAERQRKAFDPQETAALEEAVTALMEQLRTAADEAVERVAQASQHINRLLATTERRMETLWVQEWGRTEAPQPAPTKTEPQPKGAQVLDTDYLARTSEVYRLADDQLDEAAIAERTGFERAEVRVLLSLRNLSRQAG